MSSDLFTTLEASADRFRRASRDEDSFTISWQDHDHLADTLFANLEGGGLCTTLVSGRRPWDARAKVYQAARAAARRGCRIERLFLLPGGYLRHDESLMDHLALDRDAGIETLVLDVSELMARLDLPSDRVLDFGLWDGGLALSAVYRSGRGSGGPVGWQLSRQGKDVKYYEDLAQTLKNEGRVVAEGEEVALLEEPLAVSAPLARLAAPGLCFRDPETGEDCADIHRAWQYFRIFDVVPSPQRNPEFFQEALRHLARDGRCRRVLISGSCDYAMLAHLIHAYRSEGASLEVTLVDICATPQFLCNWYAKWASHPLESHVSNILDFRSERPFDAICTHSFLYNFAASARPPVIAKWHELLRPGGKLVTSARISDAPSNQALSWQSEHRQAFRQRIYRDAVKWQGLLDLDPDEIAADAEIYAGRPGVSYPIKSRDELAELFEGGGFAIETLDLVQWGGTVDSKAVGPGTNRPATYAHIVVSRR